MIIALLFAAGALFIFGRAWNGEFLFDDQAILDMEPKFQRGAYRLVGRGFRMFWHDLKQPRSLTHAGYYWTWRAFGFDPRAWHGVNLALHAVAVGLTYAVCRPVFGPWTAAIAAGLFGYHPHQVAAVCYVSGRAALQATVCCLGALYFVSLGGLWWILAVLLSLAAWKSKQDGIFYVVFWPIYSYLLSTTRGTIP